jgi:hypothetical protein
VATVAEHAVTADTSRFEEADLGLFGRFSACFREVRVCEFAPLDQGCLVVGMVACALGPVVLFVDGLLAWRWLG